MANLTEDEIAAMCKAEIARCAHINEALATKWEASAARILREGTRYTIFHNKRVSPYAERNSRDLLAAARGLRACTLLMRKGCDPLKVSGISIVATDPNTGGPVVVDDERGLHWVVVDDERGLH